MDWARCFSAVFTASEPFDDLVQNRPPGGVTLLACAEASMESLKLYVCEGTAGEPETEETSIIPAQRISFGIH
jgi:hypothetical protein